MSTISVPRPPHTPAQAQTLRMLSSRVHFAFAMRPPINSPDRLAWETLFLGDVIPLLNLLKSARFEFVPSLAMGCVWENNTRFLEDPPRDTLDIEALAPVLPGHPALDKVIPEGMKRLKYTAADTGPYGLLGEDELQNCWWTAFTSSANRSPNTPSDKTLPTNRLPPILRERIRSPIASSSAGTRPNSVAPADDDVGDESLMSVDIDPIHPPAASEQAEQAALAKIQSEQLPPEWLEHPTPCERCAFVSIKCFIHPASSSVCAFCARRKQKCSLTFNITNLPFAGFLAWAYFQIVSHPDVFGEPAIRPPEAPSVISEAPKWFRLQFVGKNSRPPFPADTAAVAPSISTATSPSTAPESEASGRSTRASKGKAVAGRSTGSTSRSASIAPSPTEERGRPATRASRTGTRSSSKKAIGADGGVNTGGAVPTTSDPLPSASTSSATARRQSLRSTRPTVQVQGQAGPSDSETLKLDKPTDPPRQTAPALPRRRSVRPAAASGQSKTAAIDVDAMDLDDNVDAVKPGVPIKIDHLGDATTVRGSEFDFTTATDDIQFESSRSRTQSPSEVADATVPPVPGTWKTLPRYEDERSAGAPTVRAAEAFNHRATPAMVSSLPVINERGKDSMAATELMRTNIADMMAMYESTRDHALTLHKEARTMKVRNADAQAQAIDSSRDSAIDIWMEETNSVSSDLQYITTQLACAESGISLIAHSVADFLSAPSKGDELAAVLKEVCQLKDAYRAASAKFHALQEDIRPVRREVHRLRGRADSAEAVAEAAATEAAYAVEPLLSNLHSLIFAELQAMQLCVAKPMERMAHIIGSQGGIAPELLQRVVLALREAVAEMWSGASGISDHLQSLVDTAAVGLVERVKEIDERVRKMESVQAIGDGSGRLGVGRSLPELAATIESISQRVGTLEIEAVRQQDFKRKVVEVLCCVGLTADVLDRLRSTGL